MTKSIVLLALVAAFCYCLIAASGGSLLWDVELKRPEAQKAINQYVQEHCRVYVVMSDLERAKANKEWQVLAQTQCWTDAH